MKVSFGDLPTDAQEMLSRHLRIDFSGASLKAPKWFSAWARNDAGHITGIFTVEFKTWFDGYVTVLVLDQRCMSRRVLRAIFRAVFSQAKRLTAEIEPGNRRALKQVQRLGFAHEGYKPLGLEGSRDVILFGMVKEECRYLPGFNPEESSHHGQSTVITGPLPNLFSAERAERLCQPVLHGWQ